MNQFFLYFSLSCSFFCSRLRYLPRCMCGTVKCSVWSSREDSSPSYLPLGSTVPLNHGAEVASSKVAGSASVCVCKVFAKGTAQFRQNMQPVRRSSHLSSPFGLLSIEIRCCIIQTWGCFSWWLGHKWSEVVKVNNNSISY